MVIGTKRQMHRHRHDRTPCRQVLPSSAADVLDISVLPVGLSMANRIIAKFVAPLLGLFLLFALLGGMAEAQSLEPTDLPDPTNHYDEAEAQAIDQRIMCPVCPAESIDQAQVPVARQMRQLVRQKLSEGMDRKEILRFFSDRYGPDILALPDKSGFNLIAWVFPIVCVAAALVAGLFVLRSMKSLRPVATRPAPRVEARLDPYLAMIDQELSRMELNPRQGSNLSRASDVVPDDVRPSGEGGSER